MPELVDVDVTAAWGGEEDASVDPCRHRVERVKDSLPQRDEPLRNGLCSRLEQTAWVALADADDSGVSVHVAALERDPLFLRSKADADSEDGHCRVALVELANDDVEFVPGLERDDWLPLMRFALRVADVSGRLSLREAARVRSGERLPEGAERVVGAACCERRPPTDLP